MYFRVKVVFFLEEVCKTSVKCISCLSGFHDNFEQITSILGFGKIHRVWILHASLCPIEQRFVFIHHLPQCTPTTDHIYMLYCSTSLCTFQSEASLSHKLSWCLYIVAKLAPWLLRYKFLTVLHFVSSWHILGIYFIHVDFSFHMNYDNLSASLPFPVCNNFIHQMSACQKLQLRHERF